MIKHSHLGVLNKALTHVLDLTRIMDQLILATLPVKKYKNIEKQLFYLK